MPIYSFLVRKLLSKMKIFARHDWGILLLSSHMQSKTWESEEAWSSWNLKKKGWINGSLMAPI